MNNTLTSLAGVRVGHSLSDSNLTGCTYIQFDRSLPVAVESSGGALGTFNTASLAQGKTDYGAHGIFISGGSTQGLSSGAKLMERMRADGIGHSSNGVYNPCVVGAIVFDEGMRIAPYTDRYAEQAYRNLSSDPVKSGNIGAGAGTSVGKFRWLQDGSVSGAMKSGVGSARKDLGNGIAVTAMTVLNSLGNIYLPDGTILAGNRSEEGGFIEYSSVQDFITEQTSNTTVTVVGVNVAMGAKEHLQRVAQLATHGHIRAIQPVHTSSDGDTVFVFSNNQIQTPLNERASWFSETELTIHTLVDVIGQAAADAVQESVYDACRTAETIQLKTAFNGELPGLR